MQVQPRRLRRLLTASLAGVLGLSGLGAAGFTTATPAAAAPVPPYLTLAVSTPELGAAANTLYHGQPVTYQLTIGAGASALSSGGNVTVTDTLPADFTLAASTSCTLVSPTLTCNMGPVAANATVTVSATLQVPNAPAEGSFIFSPKDATDNISAPSVNVSILPAADISLAKVLTPPYPAPPYAAGTAVTYRLAVSNAGPDLATAPKVTDTLPNGLTFVSATAGAGPGGSCVFTPPAPPALGTLVCTSANLPAPAGTVLDASMNGLTLPQATITVASTAGFAAPGSVLVADSAPTPQLVTCSGTTATTFTGCTGGTGTLSTGGAVTAPSSQAFNVSATIATAGTRVTTGASVASTTFDPNLANNTAVAPAGVVPYGTASDPGPCGVAVAGTRTCNLVAGLGSITEPGFASPIPIWGFAMDDGTTVQTGVASPAITLPGPTLVATEGDVLHLVVRNALATHAGDTNNLAVQVPALTTPHPDDVGVPSGSTTTVGSPSYTWTLTQPGTYVYEAGQTSNGARQLAMGLSGLLVVRPTAFTPGTAMTLFDGGVHPASPIKGGPTTGGSTTTTSPTSPTSSTTTSTVVPTTTSSPSTTSAPTTTPSPSTTSAPTTTPSPSTTSAPPTTAAAAAATATFDTVAPATTTTAAPATTTTAAPATTTTAAPATTTTAAPATTTTAAPATTTSTGAPSTTTSTAPPSTTTTSTTAAPNAAVQKPKALAPISAPAPNTACADPTTSSAFTAEALVQLNELSSQFHADPWNSLLTPGGGNDPINVPGFNGPGGSADVAFYAPDVFLVNGHAYDPANPSFIPVGANDCVALHYADLGMAEKSFGVSGLRETLMAEDSVAVSHPQSLATKYLNPGEEADVVVDMGGAAPGTKYPVMDFARHLHNGAGTPNNAVPASATGMTLGGQLTVLEVGGIDPPATAPVIHSVGLDAQTLAVNQANVPTPSQFTLTVGANASSGSLNDAEWSLDNILPAGSPSATNDPALATTGSDTITAAALMATPLDNGDHVIWVRVHDSNGWSDPAGVVFTFDKITTTAIDSATKCPDSNPNGGPVLCNLSLDPSVTDSDHVPHPVTNGATPNRKVGAGAMCAGYVPVAGVPDVSCDVIIDGVAIPALQDWVITGLAWNIDGDTAAGGRNSGLAPIPVPACNPAAIPPIVPPGCTNGPGTPVEIMTPIPQSALTGLSEGAHHVTVTATETQVLNGANTANMRTSNDFTLPFTFVVNGPTVTIDSVTPNPAGPHSDNTANFNFWDMIRIRGKISDPLPVTIAGGEMAFAPICGSGGSFDGHQCAIGAAILPAGATDAHPAADGTATAVRPSNGFWTNPPGTPVAYDVEIPSAEFDGFPQGKFRVYVHGKDQSGQWGPWQSLDVPLDRTSPTATGSLSPTPAHWWERVLHVHAIDPPGPGTACNNPPRNSLPAGCGGDPVRSGIAGVVYYSTTAQQFPEWTGTWTYYVPANQIGNDVTFDVPLSALGPICPAPDWSGCPGVLSPGQIPSVAFKVFDVAGNESDWTVLPT